VNRAAKLVAAQPSALHAGTVSSMLQLAAGHQHPVQLRQLQPSSPLSLQALSSIREETQQLSTAAAMLPALPVSTRVAVP